MKYAVKASTVIAMETISWNSISTSCDPAPYDISSVKNAKCANDKHDRLDSTIEPGFRLVHEIKHTLYHLVLPFKSPVYPFKLVYYQPPVSRDFYALRNIHNDKYSMKMRRIQGFKSKRTALVGSIKGVKREQTPGEALNLCAKTEMNAKTNQEGD